MGRVGGRSAVYHPRVLHDLRNGQSVIDIAIEHPSDQVDTLFGEWQEGDPKRVIQDLIDIIERVFLVHNCVEENAQGPDVLFFASVGLALKHFRRSVI